MIEKIKKDISKYYYILIVAIMYLIIMHLLFGQVCPVRILFHANCPGCGATHAMYYTFTGQFKKAIEANWSAFFWIIFFIAFFIDRYVHKLRIKPIPYMLIVSGAITYIRYILILMKL